MRTWKFNIDEQIHESGDDWLEYGKFGADTYGLHTTLDGKQTIVCIEASSSAEAIAEADKLLDKIDGGWRAANWECSITEAAENLGVSRQRVHAMLKAGQLEGRKIGNTWAISRDSVAKRLTKSPAFAPWSH